MPPNEVAWSEVEVLFDEAGPAQSFEQTTNQLGFVAEARYRDMNGEQASRTRVRAAHLPNTGWHYMEVTLFSGEDTEPLATLARQA